MPGRSREWGIEALYEDPLAVVDRIFERCFTEDPSNWKARFITSLNSLLPKDSWHKVNSFPEDYAERSPPSPPFGGR